MSPQERPTRLNEYNRRTSSGHTSRSINARQGHGWSACSVLLLLAILVTVVGSSTYPRLIFLSIGLTALYVVLAPVMLWRKKYDIGSVWTFVVAPVAIGVTLRNVYITLNISGDRTIDELFLRGRSPSYFVYPGILLIVGLAAVALGYSALDVKVDFRRTMAAKLARYEFDSYRLPLTIALCAGISFISLLIYVRQSGGFDPTRLSFKRTTISRLDIQNDPSYRGLGYLTFLNSFGGLAMLLMVAHFTRQRRSLWSWRGPALVAMFLLASALPVYRSGKSDVIWLVVLALIVRHYLGKPLRRLTLVAGAIATISTLSIVSAARATPNLSAQNVTSALTIQAALDALVYNRNLVELPKTAQIINRVPDVLPYENGATITGYAFSLVPRELWPSKPLVDPGPVIGAAIYNSPLSGVPPGLIAELYWNFGAPSVLLGCVLFGALLRYAHEKVRPSGSTSGAVILIYAYVVVRLATYGLGTSIGSTILEGTKSSIQVAIVLLLAGRMVPVRKRECTQALGSVSTN